MNSLKAGETASNRSTQLFFSAREIIVFLKFSCTFLPFLPFSLKFFIDHSVQFMNLYAVERDEAATSHCALTSSRFSGGKH